MSNLPMAKPVVVALTRQEAEVWATGAGVMHHGITVVTPAMSPTLQGTRNRTIVVVNRHRLGSHDLEMELCQRAIDNLIINVTTDAGLTPSAPWEAHAQGLIDAGVKRVIYRDEARMIDYLITIKDALEPPEFETAEEALAWLDQVATGQVAAGSTAPAGQPGSAPPAAASSLLWPP